ncbi:MAG: hypothetical protein Q4G09_00220 [Clostridia bacterium]|nr:hypothetical protein [Clostridia bacterium]
MRNNNPIELVKGIYQIIPVRIVKEGLRDVYSEYMNFNIDTATIIYEKRLGFLPFHPTKIKLSKYEELIEKNGIQNISGSREFYKFIQKYPEIYVKAIENEKNMEEEEIEGNEELN